MRKTSEEIQYISDSVLIEKLAALEFGLTKQAGVFDVLGGVAGAIKSQVKQQVSGDSPGEIAGGVINLMAPAMLFRLHPIVGILYLIGTSFGINITSIFSKIMALLKPKLMSGQPISIEEVNLIGKSIVSSEVGPIEAAASGYSHDMLEHLRTVNFQKLNVKTSQDTSSIISALTGLQNSQRQTLPSKIPWLMGESGGSPIQKIFGDLFASRSTGKAKWLLGGFVVWIIKTVLVGAGLLTLTGMVSNYVGNKNNPSQLERQKEQATENAGLTSSPTTNEQQEVTTQAPQANQSTQYHSIGLKPSGRGEQIFPNDDRHLWVIPLINGNVNTTLLAWVTDIYPSLHGQENIIMQTFGFQKVLGMLQKNHRTSSPNSLTMPKSFNSRKQVVDLLVHDMAGNQ